MKIMKKNSIYALMSAIALTGTIGFSSCSSTEDQAEVNPGYNSETNEVPVNFVFNVSTGNTPASTRMSQANVQATSSDVFRGMEETSLMSFKLNADDKHVASPQKANKLYGLGSILGNNDIGPDSKEKSHRILELSVPVGTNALVFYGKAKKDLNSDDTQGKISSNLSSNLSDISFSLCPRIPDGVSTSEYNTTTFTNYQNILLAIINTVVQSSFSGTIQDSGITIDDAITWEMYGTAKDAQNNKILKEKKSTGSISDGDDDPFNHNHLICGLGEILSSAFVNFNKFYDTATTTDLRAGSGTAVQKMLVDLYTVVNAVAKAIPTNDEEAVAQAVGKKIRTNLEKALASGGGKFLNISEIKDNEHLNLSFGIPTGNNDLTKFPSVFGVPEGTAVDASAVQVEAPVAVEQAPAAEEPVAEPVVENSVETPAENLDNAVESVAAENVNNIEATNEFEKKDEEEKEDKKEEDSKEDDKEDKDKKDDKEKEYALIKIEYDELQKSHAELQSKFNELSEEIERLRSFKAEVENKEKDALIAEFYMLSDADKEDVISHKAEYSLDEIKSKLAVVCFEKKVSYAAASANDKVDETDFTVNMSTGGTEVPEWLQAVDRYNENK